MSLIIDSSLAIYTELVKLHLNAVSFIK